MKPLRAASSQSAGRECRRATRRRLPAVGVGSLATTASTSSRGRPCPQDKGHERAADHQDLAPKPPLLEVRSDLLKVRLDLLGTERHCLAFLCGRRSRRTPRRHVSYERLRRRETRLPSRNNRGSAAVRARWSHGGFIHGPWCPGPQLARRFEHLSPGPRAGSARCPAVHENAATGDPGGCVGLLHRVPLATGPRNRPGELENPEQLQAPCGEFMASGATPSG